MSSKCLRGLVVVAVPYWLLGAGCADDASSTSREPGSAEVEEDGEHDAFLDSDKSDCPVVTEGSREARAILFVASTFSFSGLTAQGDAGPGLAPSAATHIVAARSGADGQPDTADDRSIASLSELDAIAFVGARAFRRLYYFVREAYLLSSVHGTVSAVYEGSIGPHIPGACVMYVSFSEHPDVWGFVQAGPGQCECKGDHVCGVGNEVSVLVADFEAVVDPLLCEELRDFDRRTGRSAQYQWLRQGAHVYPF